MLCGMEVNPYKITVVLGMILINFNTYHMIFNSKPYFDEISLMYFVNCMQFTALVFKVVKVFNELLVICDI